MRLLPLLFALPGLAQAQVRINIATTTVTAPAAAVAGQTMPVSARFESMSTASPPPFRWAVYLTLNGSLSGARRIALLGPVSLLASEARTVNAAVPVPADVSGRFTVAVVADADLAVSEYDELDNHLFAAGQTSVRPPLPDFAIDGVRALAPSLRVGDPLAVDLSLRNDGEVPGAVHARVFLSRDPVVTTADTLLGELTQVVSAGAVGLARLDAVVPAGLAVGDWTLGAIVDPEDRVAEISEVNNTAASGTLFNIYQEQLSLLTDSLPSGVVGRDYFLPLEVAGGDGHYRFSVSAGVLPRGLILSSRTGVLSGQPARSGDFPLTLRVESRGLGVELPLSLRVHPSGLALAIVNEDVADGSTGLGYEQVLVAAGGEPPYQWVLIEGSELPPGLDLRTDGVVEGVPTEIGEFSFRVQVNDEAGARDSREFSLRVSPPVNVVVLVRELAPTPVGQPVDVALEATGGRPPYRWEAVSRPPAGLRLTEQGQLTGTPSHVGEYTLRVRVRDSTAERNSDSNLIFLNVVDDGALHIDTAQLPLVPLRTPYSTNLAASGGSPPYRWSLVPGDQLPSGFFFVAEEGGALIRGTGVRGGAHAFGVRVEDGAGRVAERLLLLEIEAAGRAVDEGCTAVAGQGGALWLLVGLGLLLRRRISG